MGKDEETETGVKCSVMEVCFSFDVGRWTFDVGRSSLKLVIAVPPLTLIYIFHTIVLKDGGY
jgi:hypothetical protein